MAELTPPPRIANQLRAIIAVRWRLMRNAVRTTRGALELVAQVWMAVCFTALGLAGCGGFAVASWYFTGRGQLEWLGVLLWPLFLFWQLFPLATSAFSEQTDTTHLLRYPLGFRAYVLVRMMFGAFDAATLIGTLCLFGFTVGVAVARPLLLPVAVAAALLFAAFNIVLAQMIFAWLERWLARRKTREVLAFVFFLLIFSVNFINPVLRRWHGHGGALHAGGWARLLPLERWLPPGLPAQALAGFGGSGWAAGAAALLLLAAWGGAMLALLNLRLRAEFRGETLSDGQAPPARKAKAPRPGAAVAGPAWPGVAGPVGAVARKELKYLSRSPMMLFTLAMPVLILLLFHFEMFNAGRPGLRHHANFSLGTFGFPIGAAYALLVLTNLIFNAFGTDAVGVQFYFVAPARFRQILMGKNLAHALMLAVEVVAIFIAAVILDGPPAAWIVAATMLGMAFAALCDFACGNLISLYMPKKIDLSRLGRQGGRGTSGLAALAVQGVVFGLAALAVLAGVVFHHEWLAVGILGVWAAAAAAGYLAGLQVAETIAPSRREALIAELSKA